MSSQRLLGKDEPTEDTATARERLQCIQSMLEVVSPIDAQGEGEPAFYSEMVKHGDFSPLLVKLLIVMGNAKFVIDGLQIVMWAMCFVWPHVAFPMTTKKLPGYIQCVSVICIGISLCDIGLWLGLRRLTTSKIFNQFVSYSLSDIKNGDVHKAMGQSGHVTVKEVCISYLLHVMFGMLGAMPDFDFARGKVSPLAILVIAFGMTQPWMGRWLISFTTLVDSMGKMPASDFVTSIQQYGASIKCRQSGSFSAEGDSDFWRRALHSYKVMEVALHNYYSDAWALSAAYPHWMTGAISDASLFLASQVGIYFFIFTGGVSGMEGAFLGFLPDRFQNTSFLVFGAVIALLTLIPITQTLMSLAKVTQLSSDNATLANPPTIMSAAYGHLGDEQLGEVERLDLDRFLSYGRESRAGAHLFGCFVNIDTILKLTAFTAIFSYLVSKIISFVHEGIDV